jgi:general secretion pathway protein K
MTDRHVGPRVQGFESKRKKAKSLKLIKNMFQIIKNQRGMALLMTILIISLIMVVTLRFNMSMRASLSGASNLQDNVTLDYMAKSVFNASRAILSVDTEDNGYDTLHEDWANLSAAAMYFSVFFNRGQGGLDVKDHSGRIQVNSLLKKHEDTWQVNEVQKKVWLNLLSADEFELTEEEAENIIEAIVDWIDENDDVYGFGGAESSYYQALENPYSTRNGPMEFIEELLLIKGITSELFYGTEEYEGLSGLVTPWGRDGKININTADPLLLRALSDQIDLDMVDGMMNYREFEENDLSNPGWYKNAPAFPGDVTISPELITTASSFFEVSTEVVLGDMSRKVRGMIARGPGSRTELVYWKIE